MFCDYLLTNNVSRHHPKCVLHTGFLLVRLRLDRSVVVLCLLFVAFAAAFHGASGAAWFSSTPAVFAASDSPPHSSDRLLFESCHICTAIASFDGEPILPGNEQVSPLATALLVSFQPKVTEPPPKSLI